MQYILILCPEKIIMGGGVMKQQLNAAALGELTKGEAQGLESCLYITVGTGIGAGAIVGGRLVQSTLHPEMGHLLIRRHPQDTFEGICPYGKLTDFFSKYQLTSMGVGSFGPISVAKNKEDYGYITNTPKLAWKGYPFIPELEKRLGIPVSFTTDDQCDCFLSSSDL
ncbi:ROK family protein [Bacillus licheniformis]|nr:ROK family protein [Bacillus licheniformis]